MVCGRWFNILQPPPPNRLWMFGHASCVSLKLGVGCIQLSDRLHGVYTYSHKQNLERKHWSPRCAWSMTLEPNCYAFTVFNTRSLGWKTYWLQHQELRMCIRHTCSGNFLILTFHLCSDKEVNINYTNTCEAVLAGVCPGLRCRPQYRT